MDPLSLFLGAVFAPALSTVVSSTVGWAIDPLFPSSEYEQVCVITKPTQPAEWRCRQVEIDGRKLEVPTASVSRDTTMEGVGQ